MTRMTIRLGLFAMMLGWCFALAGPSALAGEVEQANFHHVHLNVPDVDDAVNYYKKFFSSVPVKFRGEADAILADRSFILFNEVPEMAPNALTSSIWHIGWGGVDGPSDYKWRKEAGVEFETELNSLGPFHYMYAYGTGREVIEVWTGFRHHRFGHVHMLANDVNVTKNWYRDNLGLAGPSADTPKPPPVPEDFVLTPGDPSVMRYLWASQVQTGGVTINIFGQPGPEPVIWWQGEPIVEFDETDGRAIDHIAFSYPKIKKVYKRMKAAGVEIVDPIRKREEFGMKSFFVRGPDKVLVEIVEAEPIPGGLWD